MATNEKALEWISSSHKDLMALPADVRRFFGYALSLALVGDQHDAAKVLKGFGSAGCPRLSSTIGAAPIVPFIPCSSQKPYLLCITSKKRASVESQHRKRIYLSSAPG